MRLHTLSELSQYAVEVSRETIAILRVVEPDGKIVEIPLLKGSSFQYLPLWN